QDRRPAGLRADTARWAVPRCRNGPGRTINTAIRTRARLRRAAQAGTRRALYRRRPQGLVHRPPRPGPPQMAAHRLRAVRHRNGGGRRGGRFPRPPAWTGAGGARAGLGRCARARGRPGRPPRGPPRARRLLGFRRSLTTTAAGQARPAGQADLLDDYLPYAIVFGCTKQWAELSA